MDFSQVKRLLKKHEGLSLSLYKCPAGKLTIGYGHNIEDRGISEEAAELLLEQDMMIAYKQVKNAVKCFEQLSEPRQYVLIEMLRALDGADYKTAAKEMLDSRWAAQVKGRAAYLSGIMASGIW